MNLSDFDDYRHFKPDELEKIGGYDQVDKSVMDIVEQVRRDYGKRIRITRAFSTPEQNDAVGGSRHSKHLTGFALDICPHASEMQYYPHLVMSILRMRIGGLGLYTDGHVHIDTRSGVCGARWIQYHGEKREWTWDSAADVMDYYGTVA